VVTIDFRISRAGDVALLRDEAGLIGISVLFTVIVGGWTSPWTWAPSG